MHRLRYLTFFLPLLLMAFSEPVKAQVPGFGLRFDGDDDYVNVSTTTSDELNPVEDLTLECWVFLNEVPSGSHEPHLISRFNCYALTVAPNGHARAYMHNDEGDWFLQDGTTTITTNKWYHLAATYDGSQMSVFVNGKLEGSTAVWDTMARTTANFRIGARNAYVTNTNTNGMIDEARVWDIPRTEAEIQASMNRTIPGSTPGLVGYWRFDEGSGSLTDGGTSHDNDGTLMHMALPSAWIRSTAAIGETSVFAESADISETSECSVDVEFRSGDGPGPGFSMSVMQVNFEPDGVAGLHPDRAGSYWEIWSEDPDFDGDFTADVRFHYDDIDGLPSESSLVLFRRDDATRDWQPAEGYTLITDDGGSSSATDGIGYVEGTITENSSGQFSGQYILSWSDSPPVVSDIPDQSVPEGSVFPPIFLDNYVHDPDHADSEITWTATAHPGFTIEINNRVATVTINDPDWNGSVEFIFTATDPEGESDSDQVNCEVTPVNDPPAVDDIPDQEVIEGGAFTPINLDDYVDDPDDTDQTLTWTATGQAELHVDINERVVTIAIPDVNWNGSETITFQVEDPDGETAADQATFTVTPVNDAPVVEGIPNQSVKEDEPFAGIPLDDYVTDVDDPDSTLVWSVKGDSHVTVAITNRVATIIPNDPEWSGADWVVFIAEDPDGLQGSDTVRFHVAASNDPPVVADIPDQTITEGQRFHQINLDLYVADADHADDSLSWTATGQSGIRVSIVDRVANLLVDDRDWNGCDTIIFTAKDPQGAWDSDTGIFRVTGINDAPILSKPIPDTAAMVGKPFLFELDPNTFHDVDPGDRLVLSATMSSRGSTPAWLNFDAASGTFSGTPAEGDKGMVEAIVVAADSSSASVADTFNILVFSYVGINENLRRPEINLFPNPNAGSFTIESTGAGNGDVVLEIFNERGQIIWNSRIRTGSGPLRERLNLEDAPPGLYLLRIRTREGTGSRRFIISE